jgi:hypothetical protein
VAQNHDNVELNVYRLSHLDAIPMEVHPVDFVNPDDLTRPGHPAEPARFQPFKPAKPAKIVMQKAKA